MKFKFLEVFEIVGEKMIEKWLLFLQNQFLTKLILILV